MDGLPKRLREPLIRLLLSIADDKFFLGHRNADWTGLAPFLEEDIAFSNIAQDEIAHAQELYKLAATLTDSQSDITAQANRLAYGRSAHERLNATLVELSDNFDWAAAIARQFFYDHFDAARLPRLSRSSFKPLADLAGKMQQEISFHAEHFDGWMRKLGQGTSESIKRLQQAVEVLWPHALGLFEPVVDQQELVAVGIYPGSDAETRNAWLQEVGAVLKSATLAIPPEAVGPDTGGRAGKHTRQLEELLGELVEVYDYDPGAAW